jgi:hypothetical protein
VKAVRRSGHQIAVLMRGDVESANFDRFEQHVAFPAGSAAARVRERLDVAARLPAWGPMEGCGSGVGHDSGEGWAAIGSGRAGRGRPSESNYSVPTTAFSVLSASWGNGGASARARSSGPGSRLPLQTFDRKPRRTARRGFLISKARWQSGHAAACKAVYAGSIPTLASNCHPAHP